MNDTTDVDMGGQTSAAEDIYGDELVAQAIGFARKIAKHCSHPRKRPICATCQEREAVPRIRKKRVNKLTTKQSESASFKKCITAKQTQLAFNNLKKDLAEFAVKELTGTMTDADYSRKNEVQQSIRALVPAIHKIEENRRIRNAKRERQAHGSPDPSSVPVLPTVHEEDEDDEQEPEREPVSDMLDDFEERHDDEDDDEGITDGPLSSFIETKLEMTKKLKTPPAEPIHNTTLKAKLPLRKRVRPQ
jgi:hypothetical protein